MVLVSSFNKADVATAYTIFKKGRVSPWSFGMFEKSAMNDVSVVAKRNNIIVGYILLSSVLDELTIEDITVDSIYRGQGIGRKLMEAALELANKMQQKTLYLEVRCSNQVAIELYRSQGFELVGERKNYYDTLSDASYANQAGQKSNQANPRENAYVMKKTL